MRVACFLALALAACVSADAVRCDDGRVCPATYTCGAAGQCYAPSQVAACEGKADGEPCTTTFGPGICVGGGCAGNACGNGVVEPGEACDDGNTFSLDGCNGTCTSDESCGNGIVELVEECDCGDADHPGATLCNDTFNGGAVCSQTCLRRRCGDGVTDPDEICDDGNNVPGDGCSFDCASDESCANDIVDFFAGEQCDDGNTLNRDGCSASCTRETQAWQLLPLAQFDPVPPLRSHAAMTYDSARRRIVMFGGQTPGLGQLADTWELDNNSWLPRATLASPSPRHGAMMAFDAARSRVVLFGGTPGGLYLNDTWEYDGVTWTQRMVTTSPPGRMAGAMTYDAERKRIVLFGGFSGTNHADTWEYDGVTWTQRTTATSPPGRRLSSLVYDPTRNVSVLFGGLGGVGLGLTFDDTWELDGATWTQRTLATKPPLRNGHGGVFDVLRGKVVVFGGTSGGSSSRYGDMWQLDATGWTLAGPNAPGDGLAFFGIAYDLARERMVVSLGTTTINNHVTTTYFFDGAWGVVQRPALPSTRSPSAMTYDLARGRIVMFGSELGGAQPASNETWELVDGVAWTQMAPTASPVVVSRPAITYDPVRRLVVMFGGRVGGTPSDRMWEYDGTTWTERTFMAVPKPGPRGEAVMTYDLARRRIVLFGGGGNSAFRFSDTWEFDGVGWTQVMPATVPPARGSHAMVYDAKRQRVVMFGGDGSTSTFADTWEYDGTNWVAAAPMTSPVGRDSHVMVYDPLRARVVLFGGRSSSELGDTWEYDGTTWTPFATPISPSGRRHSGMVYDAERGAIVLFGGQSTVPHNDTWTYGYPPVVAGEACRAGVDADHDGAIGCADAECWGSCSPTCGPGAPMTTCLASPACGDGLCTAVESCRSCAADCPPPQGDCPIACGDQFCDAPTETTTSCPGDC
ncbi:MAG TPA: kelch repeat-containing protein [Kofleriaceae bacterium]